MLVYCFLHVGWQPTYYNVPTEVRVLSEAYNESRRLALGRLLDSPTRAARARQFAAWAAAHDGASTAAELVETLGA